MKLCFTVALLLVNSFAFADEEVRPLSKAEALETEVRSIPGQNTKISTEAMEQIHTIRTSVPLNHQGIYDAEVSVKEAASNYLNSVANHLISQNDKELIERLKGQRFLSFSEVVIGRGVEAASYVKQRAEVSPQSDILIVEQGMSSNGRLIDRSSVGSLTSFPSTIHDRAKLRSLTTQTNVTLFLSDAQVLRSFEVVSISPLSVRPVEFKDARYLVMLKDQKSGETLKVYTERVITTTSMSRALPHFDQGTQDIVKAEKEHARQTGLIPRVESSVEFFERTVEVEAKSSLLDLQYQKVAISSQGENTGLKTALFFAELLDQAPNNGFSQTKTGKPSVVYWFTGKPGQVFLKYMEEVKAKYPIIARAIVAGNIIPVDGVVNFVRPTANGYHITLQGFQPEIIKETAFDKVIIDSETSSRIENIFTQLNKEAVFKNNWRRKRAYLSGIPGHASLYYEHHHAPGVFLIGSAANVIDKNSQERMAWEQYIERVLHQSRALALTDTEVKLQGNVAPSKFDVTKRYQYTEATLPLGTESLLRNSLEASLSEADYRLRQSYQVGLNILVKANGKYTIELRNRNNQIIPLERLLRSLEANEKFSQVINHHIRSSARFNNKPTTISMDFTVTPEGAINYSRIRSFIRR